jgi:hypothetical protein
MGSPWGVGAGGGRGHGRGGGERHAQLGGGGACPGGRGCFPLSTLIQSTGNDAPAHPKAPRASPPPPPPHLAEDLGVGRDDAVLPGVGLHHLELHGAHAAARQESVALVGGRGRAAGAWRGRGERGRGVQAGKQGTAKRPSARRRPGALPSPPNSAQAWLQGRRPWPLPPLGPHGRAPAQPRSLSCLRPRKAHLAHGAVGLQEVGLEEGVEQVAGDALDGVVNGQHVHALAVLDISALGGRGEGDAREGVECEVHCCRQGREGAGGRTGRSGRVLPGWRGRRRRAKPWASAQAGRGQP